jgi:hypothetical protein
LVICLLFQNQVFRCISTHCHGSKCHHGL